MLIQYTLMIFGLIIAAGLIIKLATTGTLIPKDAPNPPGPMTRKIPCSFGGKDHVHYSVSAFYTCCKVKTGRDFWAEGTNWTTVAQLERELGIPLSPEAAEAVGEGDASLSSKRRRSGTRPAPRQQ